MHSRDGSKMRSAPSAEEKQSFISQLVAIQEAVGYQKGWTSHKYREMFGVWPRMMDRRPAPVEGWVWEFLRRDAVAYHRLLDSMAALDVTHDDLL